MSGALQGPPSGSMLINSGQVAVAPVSYGYYPVEGSRSVTAMYNWTSQTGYQENLSRLVDLGVETTIQSVYVDNSQNNQSCTLYMQGTDQQIVVPAAAQGVFPLICPAMPILQISVPNLISGAVTRLYYLNMPMGPTVWSSSNNGTFAPTSSLNLTASAVVKAIPGRVAKVVVNTVTAVAAITVNDVASVGGAAAGNTVLTIPIATAVGTMFALDWPFNVGIVVNFNGGSGALAISYT